MGGGGGGGGGARTTAKRPGQGPVAHLVELETGHPL